MSHKSMSIEAEIALANLKDEINVWVNSILPAEYPKWFPHDDTEIVIKEAVH